MIDKNKICLIICVNDEDKYNESLGYFLKLNVPDGMTIEHIAMRGEKNIFEAYQKAMLKSTAKYKIYMHQDVLITDVNFLINLIIMFKKNPRYGIAGVVGSLFFDDNGVWWNTILAGAIIDNVKGYYEERRYYKNDKIKPQKVAAVDGLILATQYDVNWRMDLFSGWHFYDVSQCMEFYRKGYCVGVIPQPKTACIHKCDEPSLHGYDDSRSIFLKEYHRELAAIKKEADNFPLVSVVIPTYCRPNLFKKALDSVLNQTYKNIEIFISDNSPDDKTELLMQDYLINYPNIIYEHHPEYKCANDNWNRCRKYNNPKAEYVNWLMDDDVFLPQKIEKMISFLEQNRYLAMITSYRQCIDVDGNVINDIPITKPISEEDIILDGNLVGKTILTSMMNFIGEPTTPLIRKSAMKNATLGSMAGDEKYFFSDYPTWLTCMQHGDLAYLVEPLSQFRIRQGNDQHNPLMMVTTIARWAMEIFYYWDNKIFIDKEEEFLYASKRWLTFFYDLVDVCIKENYGNTEQLTDLIEMANRMIAYRERINS